MVREMELFESASKKALWMVMKKDKLLTLNLILNLI
jgi:hypothetical protein